MKQTEISIPVGDFFIFGNLNLVENAKGLIIFAHGSGSSRFSTRNNFVADQLHKAHFSTFLFDLLTQEEERVDVHTREFRFNIPMLADRLVLVTNWVESDKQAESLPIGYFGSSTGAAAALIAAAKLPTKISAVISRGGRPDLSADFLPKVKAPTLLIVGQKDTEVIALNEQAYAQLTCEKKLILIPGATHLFQEEGTLLEATKFAINWYDTYVAKES